MGLFSSKTPEQKLAEEQEKVKKTLDKYGLDIENYNLEQIKRENHKTLQSIGRDLMGSSFAKVGLSFNLADRTKIDYLSALVSQNWIVIRQNEQIIRLLEKRDN